MQGNKTFQSRLFYQISLEQMVPDDHLVRHLSSVIDLSWVRCITASAYGSTGRPSIDPVVIAKMLLLGFFYNISSERQLMRDIQVNLAFRWYLGYDLDETIPNHSVLSKARRRLGSDFFNTLFTRVLDQCREAGLVQGQDLFVDSTQVKANASLASVTSLQYHPDSYWKQLEQDVESDDSAKERSDDDPPLGHQRPRIHRSNDERRSKTDTDATLIKRPGQSQQLGFKTHWAADGAQGIITSVAVSSATDDDTASVPDLLRQHQAHVGQPQTFTADSAYGSHACLEYLQTQGIQTIIRQRRGGNKHGKFSKQQFSYDPQRDVYLCPAHQVLRRHRTYQAKRKAYYRCDKTICQTCDLRDQCVGSSQAARQVTRFDTPYVDRALFWCHSLKGRELLKQRQTCIEGLFGQAKAWHGMTRARWRGLSSLMIQSLLTATVLNIKKLIRYRGSKRKYAHAFVSKSYRDMLLLVFITQLLFKGKNLTNNT